jgi:ABC-type branched-subunit amino acid transport system substrate-binding protein
MAPDGFTPVSAVCREAGVGRERDRLGRGSAEQRAQGRRQGVRQGFTKADGRAPDPYSVYAAQATEALIAAIKQSNGSRADVTSQLFKIKLPHSILGAVSFNANGDVTANPVTIYKVKGGKSTTLKVIVPPNSLVASA